MIYDYFSFNIDAYMYIYTHKRVFCPLTVLNLYIRAMYDIINTTYIRMYTYSKMLASLHQKISVRKIVKLREVRGHYDHYVC